MGVAHSDPIFTQGGSKNGISFSEVSPIFFRNAGLKSKLLKSVESPNIFHWKPAKKVGVVLGQNLSQTKN